ncbi:MAG: CbiX/SirB N-terminal domain-containing protein [Rhodoferax sp.]|nr:CbiX/SirB N-terminal domain-containing protein [Rhodoferax sp.]MCF8210271.1 CbiX/SirB N-terminal domain-containing protein [Rhodoferax sp.]
MTKHGVVLFAHGSRDPLWHKPMEAVAQQMLQLAPLTPVQCAYLELSTPDLATAVVALLQQGVQTIVIVPMFLGVGRHAREDLPVLVDALRAQNPTIQFELRPAVSEDQRLITLLAKIALTEVVHND